MEYESNIQKLDFAVLVPQAQRGDSRAVNSLLLGFTPMVRAFKYNSYYVHYLEQDDTEILALMAVNDAIKSFKQHNFRFFRPAAAEKAPLPGELARRSRD